MKFNYIRNQEIERLLERSVKMLNGYENIDRNSFSQIRKTEKLEDMELHLPRSSVDYILENFHFHKEQ